MVTPVVYTIVFPGAPIPLARPRLGKFGVYDSQKALKKKTIECLFQQKDRWKKLDGAICVIMHFHMPIPPSLRKKSTQILQQPHTKRPDLSNLIKYVEDCMQPHVFDDDSQIVECLAQKINSIRPETIVHVWRKEDVDLQNQ